MQPQTAQNNGFTQIYNKGWKRIVELSSNNKSSPIGLYAFFAEYIDSACGAVVCDQQFLADHFNVTTRTIRNWLNFLENKNAILHIPVAGRVCAYALDPHEVWKGYRTARNYAAFTTKTLVNKNGEIQRRLQTMFSKKQTDLENLTKE